MPLLRDLPDPGIKYNVPMSPTLEWILCPVSCQESPRGEWIHVYAVEPLCCAPETITLLTGYAQTNERL